MKEIITDFPLPEPGKTGWPWTGVSTQILGTCEMVKPWPKISIITPSFNQGKFIEETIRSVLLQGYPNLEYIVIDGGSTDNTIDVIKKYEQYLAYWVSEKDKGQSHAINKGINRMTGEIFNWINSDDTFKPGCLITVAKWFQEDSSSIIGFGSFDYVYEDCSFHRKVEPNYKDLNQMVEYWRLDKGLTQQALFIRSVALREAGNLKINLRYNMDFELQCRLIQKYRFNCITKDSLATYRLHNVSKSVSELYPFLKERAMVARDYWPSVFHPKRWKNEWHSARFLKHLKNKR